MSQPINPRRSEYTTTIGQVYNEIVSVLPRVDAIFVPAIDHDLTKPTNHNFTGDLFRVVRPSEINSKRAPTAVPDLAAQGQCGPVGEVVVSDQEAYKCARQLTAEEGLLVGGSSGAAVKAAADYAKTQPPETVIVVICTDGIRNYLDHFVSNDWAKFFRLDAFRANAEKPVLQRPVDPSAPKYDPSGLNGSWAKDQSGRWTECSAKPFQEYRSQRPPVVQNVLEAVGKTPLVKLNTLTKMHGIECEVYAKCEFTNPGGSTKDRIAVRMFELAEQAGLLKPGMTVIEPSSGNTGIGVALAAAVRGYKCIIVMPEKMSKEKEVTIQALGAAIVRTPDDADFDSPYSHIGVAFRLHAEIPNSIILDQYRNIGNPLAHYEQTAEELLDALDDRIDYIVVGTGTGGTASGIAMKVKERIPTCKIVGVDPIGSILADPSDHTKYQSFEVEGVGYNFLPGVLRWDAIDEWRKFDDKDSFETARALIRHEGLLAGGSSGANTHAALELAKGLPKDARVVVILPDGVRNYLTKFLSDDWMFARGYNA